MHEGDIGERRWRRRPLPILTLVGGLAIGMILSLARFGSTPDPPPRDVAPVPVDPHPAPVAPGPRATPVPGGLRRFLARVASLAAVALLLISVGEDYQRGLSYPGTVTEGQAKFEDAAKAFRAARSGDGAKEDDAAVRRQLLAVRDLMPFDGWTHDLLARDHFRHGEIPGFEAELGAADRVARGKGALLFDVGALAMTDSTLFDLGFSAFREAGALEPRWFTKAFETAPKSFRESIVPDRDYAWTKMGATLAREGRPGRAIDA